MFQIIFGCSCCDLSWLTSSLQRGLWAHKTRAHTPRRLLSRISSMTRSALTISSNTIKNKEYGLSHNYKQEPWPYVQITLIIPTRSTWYGLSVICCVLVYFSPKITPFVVLFPDVLLYWKHFLLDLVNLLKLCKILNTAY
jgi:hypothetical protein